MNALLTILLLALSVAVSVLIPVDGISAIVVGLTVALFFGLFVYLIKEDQRFLLQIFVAGFILRVGLGTVIYLMNAQEYFGGDAVTYDTLGYFLYRVWQGDFFLQSEIDRFSTGGGWGMLYMVAAVYQIIGRNALAIQFVNAAIGAVTAPIVYLCAAQIFHNSKVSRLAAFAVAFYPSLILWSAQGLKDGPTVFLLALAMLATLKLGERIDLKYILLLIVAVSGILTLRFYIFYMLVAAIGGSFVIGMRNVSAQSLLRQFLIVITLGLAMTYLGVLRNAGSQFERFGNLEALQRSRLDQAQSAKSGYAADVDVSTTSGALTAIPIGLVYLLFAPFPWQFQITNFRQILTLPEMVVWWASFPLLVVGIMFTLKYRLRQALPILFFTTMLTLSYSVFQSNVGTAYRQRSQLLVFYFIFVAVGSVLMKEKADERKQRALLDKQKAMQPRIPRRA